jgi:hypothetical protein
MIKYNGEGWIFVVGAMTARVISVKIGATVDIPDKGGGTTA